jgi:hypothetical protein
MTTLRRTIYPEIRVLDAKAGIVEYVASDQTLDSYNEVIMANGWRFDQFSKNAPFVDSHNYDSISCCLGKVLDYKVEGDKLVETVSWAINVMPDPTLADWGFRMTQAGFLKAVSVGFMPTRMVSKWDNDPTGWQEALKKLNMHEEDGVRCVYIEQQQKELSACVIGANPNALAKAFKAGVLSDTDLEKMSLEFARRETAQSAVNPVDAERAQRRARTAFLIGLKTIVSHL